MYGEVCLSKKKIYTDRLNMGLSQRVWVEKTVNEVETHWQSQAQRSMKVMQTVFCNIKGPTTINLVGKKL